MILPSPTMPHLGHLQHLVVRHHTHRAGIHVVRLKLMSKPPHPTGLLTLQRKGGNQMIEQNWPA